MQAKMWAAGLLPAAALLALPALSQAAVTGGEQTLHHHKQVHHHARHLRRVPAHPYYFWRHGHLHKGYYVQGRPHRPF